MHKPIIQAALPSVGALAYLGDAVHSLCVRRMLVGRGISRAEDLNRAALDYVTAESQAKVYRALLPMLARKAIIPKRADSSRSFLTKKKRKIKNKASRRDYG